MRKGPILLAITLAVLGVARVAHAQSQQIVATEVGKQIVACPNQGATACSDSRPAPAVPVNLTGATVVLRALQPDGRTTQNLAMTVAGDGLSATHSTTSSDFPIGGNYQLQLIATYPSTQVLKSVSMTITVGKAL